MKKLLISIGMAASLLLAGCASPAGVQSAQDDYFAARSAYDGTFLAGAANYNQLPRCAVAQAPTLAAPCSTYATVAKLRSYDAVAKLALDNAEDVIYNHPGTDATSLILDAQNAVTAAVAICARLCSGTAS